MKILKPSGCITLTEDFECYFLFDDAFLPSEYRDAQRNKDAKRKTSREQPNEIHLMKFKNPARPL